MRLLIGLVVLVALATNAYADTDVSLRLRFGDSDYYYSNDIAWYWGQPVYWGQMQHWSDGFALGYQDGSWDSAFEFDGGVQGYPGVNHGGRMGLPPGVSPEEWYQMRDTGVRVTPQYPTNVLRYAPVCPSPYYYDPYRPVVCYPNDYYVYPAYPRGNYISSQLYTAPDYPELDYRRNIPLCPGLAASNAPSTAPATVYNDNRTYNYYGAAPESATPTAVPQPSAVQEEPVAAPVTPAEPGARGTRFYEHGRLEVGQDVYRFELANGVLSTGPEVGPGITVCTGVDPRQGVYAAYEPGVGLSLIFRQGQALVGAYPIAGGSWWLEPLPYAVDFRQSVTIGIVGGAPWVTFTDQSGSRFIVAFSAHTWQEIGSATTSN